MKTWKGFETYVDESNAKTNVNSGMLKAQLTVLLAKNVVSYQTPEDVIQQALNERFHVEYNLSDVMFEIQGMAHEEQSKDSHVLVKEDYFDGF